MNDYIQKPDGNRIRWIRPIELEPPVELPVGRPRDRKRAQIDQWNPPEPPDAA